MRSTLTIAILTASAALLAACGSSGMGIDAAAVTSSPSPAETGPVTTINGEVPPGEMMPLQNVTTMMDVIDANGLRLLVTQGTRKAGTRVGIHIHQYGGHTCVLSGTVTDFVEGKKSMVWPAGTCYYMPPNTHMSVANVGETDALLMDTFNLPRDVEPITILEPGWPGN